MSRFGGFGPGISRERLADQSARHSPPPVDPASRTTEKLKTQSESLRDVLVGGEGSGLDQFVNELKNKQFGKALLRILKNSKAEFRGKNFSASLGGKSKKKSEIGDLIERLGIGKNFGGGQLQGVSPTTIGGTGQGQSGGRGSVLDLLGQPEDEPINLSRMFRP